LLFSITPQKTILKLYCN